MKRQIALVVSLIVLASCGGRSKTMQRGQQQYDVVQEGSAATSTSISAPGEQPPPLSTAPITNTNVDTTTAFTLPNTAVQTETTPGTVASTLPEPAPMTSQPRPRPRPRTDTATQPMSSSTSDTPVEGPPTQTTTQAPTPPPPTNTTGTSG